MVIWVAAKPEAAAAAAAVAEVEVEVRRSSYLFFFFLRVSESGSLQICQKPLPICDRFDEKVRKLPSQILCSFKMGIRLIV